MVAVQKSTLTDDFRAAQIRACSPASNSLAFAALPPLFYHGLGTNVGQGLSISHTFVRNESCVKRALKHRFVVRTAALTVTSYLAFSCGEIYAQGTHSGATALTMRQTEQSTSDGLLDWNELALNYSASSSTLDLTEPATQDVTIEDRSSKVRLPDIQIRLSTPSEYLRGKRDDYAIVGHAAEFSEYGFVLFGPSLRALKFRNTKNTHAVAKPVNESLGLELSISHELMHPNVLQNSFNVGRVELSYGVRYQQFYSYFYFLGIGSVLGRTETSTYTISDLIGPHVALDLEKEYFGCRFRLSSSFMAGLNYLEAAQRGSIGADLLPGGVNTAVAGRPTRFSSSVSRADTAAITELGASASCPLHDNLIVQLGYNRAYYVDMHQAMNLQVWTLPIMGIDPSRTEDIWADQLYATLEWRR